jgi:hypothetical protein
MGGLKGRMRGSAVMNSPSPVSCAATLPREERGEGRKSFLTVNGKDLEHTFLDLPTWGEMSRSDRGGTLLNFKRTPSVGKPTSPPKWGD